MIQNVLQEVEMGRNPIPSTLNLSTIQLLLALILTIYTLTHKISYWAVDIDKLTVLKNI
jgi:hypothetical protein